MKLPCLFCGADDATTTVDVSDGITMRCSECDHEFDAGAAADRLRKLNEDWVRVLAWLEAHPERAGRVKAKAAG